MWQIPEKYQPSQYEKSRRAKNHSPEFYRNERTPKKTQAKITD